ncbi:MAG TPA: hypothetical protein VHQ92_14160 [Pseudolabrys sp.]|jgi:hypothetical protein|nr:hypothetical protein [Pseudolabrys sp.]
MTTLPIRAPIVPTLSGFTRVITFVTMLVDVFADAQRAAAAAHKKYPFAEW